MTQACMDQLEDFKGFVMNNGDVETILGIGIEAIPACNIQHTRAGGEPYHFGSSDPQQLVELLKNEKDIEVRIRDLE